jgi:hypothetical protein
MNLPVDFVKKVQLPPTAGGKGYPYQISARDLMTNFKAVALAIDPVPACGLYLQEVVEGETRTIQLAGTLDGACLDAGSSEGDPPSTNYGYPTPPSTGTYVLGSIDGVVQWIETEECA